MPLPVHNDICYNVAFNEIYTLESLDKHHSYQQNITKADNNLIFKNAITVNCFYNLFPKSVVHKKKK